MTGKKVTRVEKKNPILELWNGRSDEYYTSVSESVNAIIQDPFRAFPIAMLPIIREHCPDLSGMRVCVPSSGDNIAAFGLHLLGARVTSADLSPRQIENARTVAKDRGWDIDFVCDDSMSLAKIADGEYDLVYTSNGVHVWIDDLESMYANIHRILRDGGHYILFDTHPMIRPFDDSGVDVKIVKRYEDIGPYGEVPTYDWRMQDFVNALIKSGFTIRRMEEFHSVPEDLSDHNYLKEIVEGRDMYDWRQNPWAALPQCFGLCVQKRC